MLSKIAIVGFVLVIGWLTFQSGKLYGMQREKQIEVCHAR